MPPAESDEVGEVGQLQQRVEEEKRRLFESLLDTCGEPPLHVVAPLKKKPPLLLKSTNADGWSLKVHSGGGQWM